MELAKPPEDPDLKNIIDKLANFVARNGPEFENMTKQKQQSNPKFSFLFGGEHHHYYQYKVQTEQAVINVQNKKMQEQAAAQLVQQQQQQPPPQVTQQPPPQVAPQVQPQVPPQTMPPGSAPAPGMAALNPLAGPPPAVVSVNTATIPPPVQVTPWISSAPPPLTTSVPTTMATMPPGPLPGVSQPPPQVAQIQGQITLQTTQLTQQTTLNEQQIKQSEQNLAAQYASFMQTQQGQIEEAMALKQADLLSSMSEECAVSLDELGKTVQPIIDSCTKDAILNGKSWIFQHCTTDQQAHLAGQYLLKRILSKEASFELRLHLIYLINDLLHHCQRKNADNLKHSLEKIVVPVFCTALIGAGEDKKAKLNKLLTLWEQNKYFDPTTIEKMKDPDQALAQYHADLLTENNAIVSQISGAIQGQYGSLQKQHQEFAAHLQAQVVTMQTQLTQLQTQLAQAQAAVISQSIAGPPAVVSLAPGMDATVAIPHSEPDTTGLNTALNTALNTSINSTLTPGLTPGLNTGLNTTMSTALNTGMNAAGLNTSMNSSMNTGFQPNFSQPPPFGPPPPFGRPPMGPGGPGVPPAGPGGLPPPPFDYHAPWGPGGPPPRPGFPLPDFSKPPPGFPPAGARPPMPMPPELDLTPSVPYYELPAGLMAPLVKLEDHDYRPLDPKDIHLPPPLPPSERLLAAVEAFYSPPFHDRPRDSEGWEKLGLYEFYKAKQKAKKLKDQRDSRSRSGSKSRSRSRSRSNSSSSSSPRRRPSPPRRRRYNSRSKASRSRSRSRSKSRSRSRSPSDSRSPLPYKRISRSPSPKRRGRSKTRSRSRSATPPGFSTEAFLAAAAAKGTTEKLTEDNKGHMLLKKMGWGGKGLGAKEQGIVDPIKASEVRDRQDKFKGIGTDFQDPFEQFRKSKSQGFITRMQARDANLKEGGTGVVAPGVASAKKKKGGGGGGEES